MKIRQVRSETDVLAAYEIEKQVYTPEAAATLKAFYMRKEIFADYFFIAEENGRIVGVTNGVRLNQIDLSDEGIKQVAEFETDGAYYCMLTIAVHPDYQRRGIASELLKQAIRQADSDRLNGIVLMCEEHLIPFYEKHGFRYVKPSASEHGGIEWHEMSLTLPGE